MHVHHHSHNSQQRLKRDNEYPHHLNFSAVTASPVAALTKGGPAEKNRRLITAHHNGFIAILRT